MATYQNDKFAKIAYSAKTKVHGIISLFNYGFVRLLLLQCLFERFGVYRFCDVVELFEILSNFLCKKSFMKGVVHERKKEAVSKDFE